MRKLFMPTGLTKKAALEAAFPCTVEMPGVEPGSETNDRKRLQT
jgi:hypothetical protein